MARQGTSSRTTAKSSGGKSPGGKRSGGRRSSRKADASRPAPGSGRLTPKAPSTRRRSSPLWVPVAMFTCLGLGVLVIMLNYLGLLPGGEAQNSDLLLGLGLLIAGFVLSTQYR